MDGNQFVKNAYSAILAHDFEQAIDWFEKAIIVEPTNDAHFYKLSITYARSNKLSKALSNAAKACKLNANNEEYKFHLNNLFARDFIEKAEKHLQHDNKQYNLAVSLLLQAITLDPLAIEAFLLLGVAYAGLEEYNNATNAVKEALLLDPQHEIAQKLLLDYLQENNIQ